MASPPGCTMAARSITMPAAEKTGASVITSAVVWCDRPSMVAIRADSC